MRVLSGKTPAPEVNEWGKLFIDGWKLNIIALIYMLPAIVVFLTFGGMGVIGILGSEAAGGDPSALFAAALSLLGGFLLAGIIAIAIWFIAQFAILRFAHTDSFGEAFNFGAIFSHIGKLGWGTWILAVIVLLILAFIYGFLVGLISWIPLLGGIIALFLNVVFVVFSSRYFALVYEDVPPPA